MGVQDELDSSDAWFGPHNIYDPFCYPPISLNLDGNDFLPKKNVSNLSKPALRNFDPMRDEHPVGWLLSKLTPHVYLPLNTWLNEILEENRHPSGVTMPDPLPTNPWDHMLVACVLQSWRHGSPSHGALKVKAVNSTLKAVV